MNGKKPLRIAAVTIGQSPRTDMTGDLLTRIPEDLRLVEYGVLDEYTEEQVREKFFPEKGDEILVSRMRSGRQVCLSGGSVSLLLQTCIDRAERDGAAAVLLLCTGVFPEFRHAVPLIRPQPLFYAVAQSLADGRDIAVMVPEREQEEQAFERWGSGRSKIHVASASPYGDPAEIERAARRLSDCGAAFLCLDCMGFSLDMKRAAGKASGLPVLLPRTLVTSIVSELLSFEIAEK